MNKLRIDILRALYDHAGAYICECGEGTGCEYQVHAAANPLTLDELEDLIQEIEADA